MNVFNRIVVLLLLLLLIVLLVVAAVVPNTVIERLIYTLEQGKDLLAARWPMSYVVLLALDVLLAFALLVLLWLEVRPSGRKVVGVRTGGGTKAEVSTDSVRQSLEHRLGTVPDVLKVKPVVQGKRGGVSVVLGLETTPEIDVPAKIEEVTAATRELIEGKMGLKLTGLNVQIKQGPYGRGKQGHAEPAPLEQVEMAPLSPAPSTSPWGQTPQSEGTTSEPGAGSGGPGQV